MDRVSGWYKRNIQFVVLSLAIVIVLFANVDSLMIADNLERDSTLRASIVESAEKLANQSNPSGSNASLSVIKGEINELQIIQIGWSKEPCNILDQSCDTAINFWDWILKKIVGLSITIFAISLGAPFWFDILNKLVNIRGSGKKPEKPNIL